MVLDPSETSSVSAQGIQRVPQDAKLQAALLHELLAPSLLRLLETKLEIWEQRQEQFLHAALNKAMNKQEPNVGVTCTRPGPHGLLDERKYINESKGIDERQEIDEKKYIDEKDSKESNRNQSPISGPVDFVTYETLDSNQIRSVLEHDKSTALARCRSSVQNFFSKLIADVTSPWRRGGSCRTITKGIVDSKSFTFLCGVVMISHGALMATSTNVAMEHALKGKTHAPTDTMRQVNAGFGGFYTIELVMRMLADGRAFFTSREKIWNMFDVFMVALALEEILQTVFVLGDHGGGNVVFMRLFRLLKLLKALRFVRLLRSFRDLRLMIGSIFGCVKSMLWAMVLLSMITFLFGLFFVQACVGEVATNASIDPVTREGIETYWPSVHVAMNSLFLASTGGDSWRYMADPLLKVSPFAYGGFMIYMVFFLFVIANTLTSLFIDSYIDSAAKDDSMLVEEQNQKRKEIIERAVKVSREVDQDESGIIDISEFDAVCKNPELAALMDSLAVDPANVREFFDMLSQNGQRPVTIEQFVNGCMKIRGPARSVDLVVVIELLHFMDESLSNFMHYCRAQFDNLITRSPSSEFAI